MGRVTTVPKTQNVDLLTIGEGTIGAATRRSGGEQLNDLRIDRFTEALRGTNLYTQLPNDVYVPCICVDGRRGAADAGPNAAGGTFSLVIADALTRNVHRTHQENAPDHARNVFSWLRDRGLRIGGHDDMHAQGANCGCGAQDKLDNTEADQPSILAYLSRRADDVRKTISSLGVGISDELHAQLTQQVKNLRHEHYATTGDSIKQAYLDVAGSDSVVTLLGKHNEVAVVINLQAGTTLDRDALAETYGDELQAFNVDVWALKQACDEMSLTPEESHERFVAALYYNVATAAVLADTSLRVIIRS